MKNLDYNQIINLEIIGGEDKDNIYIDIYIYIYIYIYINLTKLLQFGKTIWHNHGV